MRRLAGMWVRRERRRHRDATLKRLRGHGDPTFAAVGRALAAAVADPDASERSWITRIEELRSELGRSDDVIDAPRSRWSGDPTDRSKVRHSQVSRLALEASKPARWGRVLLGLTRELRPRRALELGTCIGLSTAYQAAGLEISRADGGVVTLEADPSRVELALSNLERLGLAGRVTTHPGRFEDTLDEALREAGEVELAFVDGHHKRRPTVAYFERISASLTTPGVIVFDDISWSRGMRRAWEQIAGDRRVSLALDLHGLGLCVIAAAGPGPGGGEQLAVHLHP